MMTVVLLGTLAGSADELPELLEKPWLASWIANGQREFDYSVGAKEARARLFPKVRKSEGNVQAGIHDKFRISFVLEEMKGGKWTSIPMLKDGFETDQDASAEVESCELLATYEGGSKAKISHRFERKTIIISTELVNKATDNPMRVGVLIFTPTIHYLSILKTVSAQEEAMEDDEIRAVRVDGKKLKLNLIEDVKLSDSELLGDGAEEFSLEVERYGGKPITMSSSAKGGGVFQFVQKKRLFEQFEVTWYPAENKKPAQGAELVISFK